MKTTKQYFVMAIVLLILTGFTTGLEADFKPPATDMVQSWTDQAYKNDPMDFQFANVTDRTGALLSGCPGDGDTLNKRIGPELLVMSFNIRNGRAEDGENRWEKRRDIFYDIFRNHKPDVVGLQEAVSFQIDEICTALPDYDVVKGSKEGKTNGQYVAILYRADRFRVEEYATFWFSRTPDLAGSKHPDNNWARTCTWAKLTDKKSGYGFFVYNLHLGGLAIEENIQLLGRRLRDRKPSYPVIVLGDFNADESNPAILYMKGNISLKPEDHDCADTNPVPLIDSFRVLHPDVKAGTYNGFKGTNNGNKIDYVFVLPDTEVIEAQILHDNRDGRYPSDHFPVTARIRLHSNEY